MSKNSDFFKTSAKCPRLPQYLKKALALNSGGAHHDGAVRRMFIDAHQRHVAFRLKRGNDPVESTEAE